MEHTPGRGWVLLVYKVPRDPTAIRAGVWRKVKRMGAILLHDAVWVLPFTARTREQFQWLTVEIHELGGDAMLFAAQVLPPGQEEQLVAQFQERVDLAYQAILTELERDEADVVALSRRYQHTTLLDFFESTIGQRVRQRLLAGKGGDDQ